ncbi:RNA polymerase sigma factor [Pseudonocardia humida]|uniref:Sigma-70 family RNA polymerase sigma factor n=1 Tax=Pseudonocardia humida TaxID=2800819 RepID=A0ABT1A541_9PSEU|nr:sigma-70 family RNA polymerase sigma factor [Pseudonocardia humida]MCO1658121.1 sigma-70 family RNA polymerase sigma factor [Pseudonocardia humida]
MTADAATAEVAAVEPMVRAICRNRLGHHAGDDVAQRVLLRIWQSLDRGREFDNLHTYAAASARYESMPDSVRRAGRRPEPLASGELVDFWADPAPGPAEQVERTEQAAAAAARVEDLLGQLTPGQAQALRATVLAERSTDEAARELGLKPTSVRSAQVRAMARLRELCGARSTNPLASNRTSAERGKHAWQLERARLAARQADADGGSDEAHSTDDPVDLARAAAVTADHAVHQLAHPVPSDEQAAERAESDDDDAGWQR